MVQHNCHRCMWNTQNRNIFVEKMGKRRWRSIQGTLQWKPLRKKNSNTSQFPVAFAPSGALYDMMRHYRSTNYPTFESSLVPTPQELVPLVASTVSVHLVSQYSVDAHRSSNSRKRSIISFDGECPCCPFFKIWSDSAQRAFRWVDGFVRFPSFPDWKFTELGSFWVHIARRGFKPGVTAVHLRLQPVCVPLPSVWKKMFTVLVRVVMIGGRK